MKEILIKIKKGDPLTDEELDKAIAHYKILDLMLLEHGLLYALTHRDVSSELNRLLGYKESRKRK